ncbi:MAG: SMC-Scp complex subunit ScpB [Akkermansiaceae bacterium]|nr:SMC-Scp complex subunit ScpB [Akkermansiaceae bacterium]
MDLSAVIEALLVASEDPLPSSELARLIRARVAELEDEGAAEGYEPEEGEELAEDLADLARIDDEAVTAAIAELNRRYEEEARSFTIMERAKGWKIYTRPAFAGFIRHLFPGQKPRKLSPPAMETLAIIAYRQPVTKAAIEAVRGVSCDGMLQKLLDLELVKIGGRATLPGRPLLYETTDYFFEHFGIKSVEELPNAAELRKVPLPEPEEEAAGDDDQPAGADDEDDEKQLALVEPSGGAPAAESPPADFSAGDRDED